MPYLKMDDNPLFVKDADLICIKRCDSFIPSYLYHFFFTTEFRTYLKKITHDATIAHYTINQIKDTPIPIPPLEEQKRIVSILDRFEALTTDLQSGLPAEIEARRKQYEYYREQLLTFKRKTA
jgi:type I restriction enzyme S subunit